MRVVLVGVAAIALWIATPAAEPRPQAAAPPAVDQPAAAPAAAASLSDEQIGRFLREVVAELRKVIWPTRNQMVTYTIVVIVFVAFMVALVGVLDLLFAKGVLAVFG